MLVSEAERKLAKTDKHLDLQYPINHAMIQKLTTFSVVKEILKFMAILPKISKDKVTVS
ncbi:MAG: hypothetical protein PHN80_07975 [Hespellia sp.]|nr:hypothetical protein [Hespellia sp.]